MKRIGLSLAFVLIVLTAYAIAYFGRSDKPIEGLSNKGIINVRWFQYPWEAQLFKPAAAVESVITNKTVIVRGGNPLLQ